MKTKLVYVLVSTPSDFYYEQVLISAWSAKYWNPDMKILLVVDELTDATQIGKRTALADVVDEKIVIDLSEGGTSNYTSKERSRMLKTNLRSYVRGDILYVDTDTVVCGTLEDIDSFNMNIGAVNDGHRVFDPVYFYDVVERAKAFDYDSIAEYCT